MSDFRFINRCMVWLTLFFMLSAGFYVPTAQAEDRASVTSDNIEMRQGPGDNYNIVTKLNKGAEVIVEGSYDDWLRVTSGADSGWLPAAAVQAAGAPQSAADNDQQPSAPASAPAADTPAAVQQVRVKVTAANLREQPSENGGIIKAVPQGSTIRVTQTLEGWYQVVTLSGQTGYISASVVEPLTSAPASAPAADTPAAVQQVRVKVTAANLREQPSENGGIIKAVPQGSTIRVTQTLEGWYQVVTLSGQTGYISASVVEPLTSAPASAPAPAPASAAGDISVYVNQQAVVFTDAHPVIVNSRTLVPLRAVMEAVGAVVGWDADKRQVTVTRADKYLIMPVDSHQPTINGQVVDIDVPPQIINNRTFIPVRFVSESLGDQVDWQAENKRIDITVAASPTVPDPLPAPIDESKPGDTPLNPGASLGGDVIGEQHLSSNQLQLSVVNENGGLALIIKAGSSMDPEWSEDKNGFTLKFARGNWVDNIVKKDAMGPGNIYINTKNEAEGCSLQIIYPQAAMYEKQLADGNKTLKIYFPNHIYEILEDNYGDYGAKIAVRTLFPAEFTSYDINQGQQLNFTNLKIGRVQNNYSFQDGWFSQLSINEEPAAGTLKLNVNGARPGNFKLTRSGKDLYIFLLNPNPPSSERLVVLDPGHGGYDPGAVRYGSEEKEFTLAVALRAGEILSQSGFQVVYTRRNDITAELEERSLLANTFNAKIFVSVHANAHDNTDARGLETYFYAPAGNVQLSAQRAERERLAVVLQARMLQGSGLSSRGIKEKNLSVLRNAKMPSALVEIGFMSNAEEKELIFSSPFQEKAAQALAAGIMDYMNESTQH